LETTYVELAAYHPGVYSAFNQTIVLMKFLADECYDEMQRLAQDAVLAFIGKQPSYSPAMLGNALRERANLMSMYLDEELKHACSSVREFLVETINKRDDALLEGKQKGVEIQPPAGRKYSTLDEFVATKRVPTP
jgi:hypothetical protein